jgi:hypothetical protein
LSIADACSGGDVDADDLHTVAEGSCRFRVDHRGTDPN